MSAVKALSIKQPWAWLIVNGYKDVENRSWPTNYRGPLLIHASKSLDTKGAPMAALILKDHVGVDLPKQFELGGIVGQVDLVDCVKIGEHQSPWFFGKYGFVLANAKELPFRPLRGQLSFFNVEVPGVFRNG